jgi:hypothetical protein
LNAALLFHAEAAADYTSGIASGNQAGHDLGLSCRPLP